MTGQANYGFGNLACSQLCRFRRNAGLPGLAVGWGPVGNVGFVVDNSDSLVRFMTDALAFPPQVLFGCFSGGRCNGPARQRLDTDSICVNACAACA